MPKQQVGSLTRYTASRDGRLIGLLVPASFDEFADYHPNDGRRSYVTEPELPLQIVTAKGSPLDRGSKHVHMALEPVRQWATRHKVVVCLAGAVRIDLSEADGTPVGAAEIRAGDALLCTEGHEVTYLEANSRMMEIKQGPYPGSQDADRVVLS